MFKDNPLLQQLKQQIRENLPQVEGQVKATDKGFGFLETEKGDSYFLPPPAMKKVLHGDKVKAVIRTDEKERQQADPEELVAPSMERFIGKVQKQRDRFALLPDQPGNYPSIGAKLPKSLDGQVQEGDWVVAHLQRHPLKGDRGFFANIERKIAAKDDPFAPWWVILARHDMPIDAPDLPFSDAPAEEPRKDITERPLVTIDSASTRDMDDALYIEKTASGWHLTVAIADPTAFIEPDTKLDKVAAERAFTLYLPDRNIPMLPRELCDHICSLVAGETRPALVCEVDFAEDGTMSGQPEFYSAWVKSAAKLSYSDVSDYFEGKGDWQPAESLAPMLQELKNWAEQRLQWRQTNALVFKDRPDYEFELDDNGQVIAIHAVHRRIAQKIVEESMLAANVSAANILATQQGVGIFTAHSGYDDEKLDDATTLLAANNITANAEELKGIEGFKALRRQLDDQPTAYLEARMRRFQAYGALVQGSAEHFGLGFEHYATWTSPIRKYGDMVNHRLLKAIIAGQPVAPVSDALLENLNDKRKRHRMAERDVRDWLYCRYFAMPEQQGQAHPAEIIDISKGGVRVRMTDTGAVAFMPASMVHGKKDELELDRDNGEVRISGERKWRLADAITVTIHEANETTRSIIVKPA